VPVKLAEIEEEDNIQRTLPAKKLIEIWFVNGSDDGV
jgi:hypothetical protein